MRAVYIYRLIYIVEETVEQYNKEFVKMWYLSLGEKLKSAGFGDKETYVPSIN